MAIRKRSLGSKVLNNFSVTEQKLKSICYRIKGFEAMAPGINGEHIKCHIFICRDIADMVLKHSINDNIVGGCHACPITY